MDGAKGLVYPGAGFKYICRNIPGLHIKRRLLLHQTTSKMADSPSKIFHNAYIDLLKDIDGGDAPGQC